MKVLVFGSDGFIGRNVCKELEKSNDVVRAVRDGAVDNVKEVQVDLGDQVSIGQALKITQPEIIVNCAGVVDVSTDVNLNAKFTQNIIEQAIKINSVKKIIISGSAGEYGAVDQDLDLINEDVPLNANSGYGLSKVKEELLALEYNNKNGIDIVILRIFNPIGKNMAGRFLIMQLLQQIKEFKNGNREFIELSRLDAKRDYTAIQDVAAAFRVVVENDTKHSVYNVGSGHSTTNGELLRLLLKSCKLLTMPQIKELSAKAEVRVADKADITRLFNEFGWRPVWKIDESIEEIVNG